MGDGTYNTALAWQVLLLTGSAADVGVIVGVQFIPLVLFTLIGGVAADSLPRRLVMLWSDIGRAVAMFSIALLAWLHLLQLWQLMVISLLFGVVRSFFNPAYDAVRPQLVDKESLSSANALTSFSRQMSRLLGPTVGAACIALAGPASAFAFNGLTFVASAAFIFVLRVPGSMQDQPDLSQRSEKENIASAPDKGYRSRAQKVVKDLGEGLRFVASAKWLWTTIVVTSIVNLGLMGPLSVAFPALVYDVYRGNIWLLGFLTTMGALGTLAATFIVGNIRKMRRRGVVAYLALIFSCLALIWFGLPLPLTLAIGAAILAEVVIGFCTSVFNITWITVIQELVPGNKLGRVLSISSFGSIALVPLAYYLTGVLSDTLGTRWVFVAGGTLILLFSLIGFSVREVRRVE